MEHPAGAGHQPALVRAGERDLRGACRARRRWPGSARRRSLPSGPMRATRRRRRSLRRLRERLDRGPRASSVPGTAATSTNRSVGAERRLGERDLLPAPSVEARGERRARDDRPAAPPARRPRRRRRPRSACRRRRAPAARCRPAARPATTGSRQERVVRRTRRRRSGGAARGAGSGSTRSTGSRAVAGVFGRPARVSKNVPPMRLDVGHAAALRRVDGLQGRAVPVQVERAAPLAGRDPARRPRRTSSRPAPLQAAAVISRNGSGDSSGVL